jgi:hypothetical protein
LPTTQLPLRFPRSLRIMEGITRSASCIYCQQPYQREPRERRPVVSDHALLCASTCCDYTPTLRLFSVLLLFSDSHIPLSRPLLLCRFTHAFTRPAAGVRSSWRLRVRMAHLHARAAQRCAPNPRTNCLKTQSRSSCFQPQQQVERFLVHIVWAKMRPQCIAARATGPSATIAAPLPTAKVQ